MPAAAQWSARAWSILPVRACASHAATNCSAVAAAARPTLSANLLRDCTSGGAATARGGANNKIALQPRATFHEQDMVPILPMNYTRAIGQHEIRKHQALRRLKHIPTQLIGNTDVHTI